MLQKPSTGRAIIKRQFNSLCIEIPSKKNWSTLLMTCLWMCGWAVGETLAIKQVLSDDQPLLVDGFLLIWLTGWTFGGIMVMLNMIWQFIGREIITVERGIFKIEKNILGMGPKKEYHIKPISKIALNLNDDLNNSKRNRNNSPFVLNGMKGGAIKFDYGMKTIKFAIDIDEAEARTIIEKLKSNTNFKEENFSSSI